MTTLGLLLMSSVGVWLVSGRSPPAPQECLAPPCQAPPDDLPMGKPWPPRCLDQCLTDRDCGPRGLCCPMCGCKSCQEGAPIDKCLTKACPLGTVCVRNTRLYCKRSPCPLVRCVKVSTKPGSCPLYPCAAPPDFLTCTNQCKTDTDCKGSDKCCGSCLGCQTCEVPVDDANACSCTKCPGGETCVDGSCVCNDGIVNCLVPPCQFARCDNHPNAVCSDNYCGGCHAVWSENGQIVHDCGIDIAA